MDSLKAAHPGLKQNQYMDLAWKEFRKSNKELFKRNH